jgi:hypothetical protein
MDEDLVTILKDSIKVINRLQLLSVFFGEEVIYMIYLRSQVIHKLFESNPELDFNKLELFHLQYTTTVVELLRKIKTTNEKNVSLLFDEMQINNDLIEKLDSAVFTDKNFNLDKQKQTLKINLSLRKLYQLLSDRVDESPFSKNINAFSARFSADFYYDISPNLFNELVAYKPGEVYRNTYATIQRKLLGLLCKTDFKTEFCCGLKAGSIIIEVYKFMYEDRYFLFLPSRNLFLFCDLSKITDIDWSNTLSKKARIIQELQDKNNQLETTAAIMKTAIPPEIKTLLTEYYDKIDDVNFFQNMSNFDVQANILKTMLNTDII